MRAVDLQVLVLAMMGAQILVCPLAAAVKGRAGAPWFFFAATWSALAVFLWWPIGMAVAVEHGGVVGTAAMLPALLPAFLVAMLRVPRKGLGRKRRGSFYVNVPDSDKAV